LPKLSANQLNKLTGVTIPQEKYSRVKIYADDNGFKMLASLGVCTDHGTMKKGFWLETDLSASEIEIVRAHGFTFDILIDDVSSYYVEQNNPSSGKYAPPTVQSIGCNPPPTYAQPSNFT